jgi:hypothetical protein
MAGFKIANLDQLIAKIPQHTTPLPPSAERPIEHYQRGASDARSLLLYFERNVPRTKIHPAKFERHATTLRNMVLIGLIESFERYLKEVAALCADHIAPLVLDDRLSVFRMNMRGIAAQFSEGSLGKAICESATWLDTVEINDRFGKTARRSVREGDFSVFPAGQVSRRVAENHDGHALSVAAHHRAQCLGHHAVRCGPTSDPHQIEYRGTARVVAFVRRCLVCEGVYRRDNRVGEPSGGGAVVRVADDNLCW